ncbi:MAG: flippase-like domain-containing protein [Elusimicrobia bacterium]|nr:flippase-like domain-containing protein [Elusimicrobiota bacterium]
MRRARAWFTPVVLILGAATFAFLLWGFGPARVWERVAAFGWGFAVVLPFQIFDHMLNAAGWGLAFAPGADGRLRFRDLVRVRIAGDGVNYLTPSASVAGEFVRPGMLGNGAAEDAKVASVVVAKAAQAAAQALFVLLGLFYLLHWKFYALSGRQLAWGAAAMLLILGGVAAAIVLSACEPPAWALRRFPEALARSRPVRLLLREYLRRHPGRMAGSVLCFALGYAWGAVEVWLIAFFLGLPLAASAALAVEFLSNLVDAMAFMVPAKIGTQEAGKTAIFAGLGLPPEAGFTLGLIRHARELAWAALGMSLYAAHQRRLSRGADALPPSPEPAARAG